MIKGYWIANETISEVEFDEHSIRELQKLVGGYFEVVELGNKDALFVDEEGLLKPQKYAFRFLPPDFHPQPFVGNGVIVGTKKDGDITNPHKSIEFYRKRLAFGVTDDAKV